VLVNSSGINLIRSGFQELANGSGGLVGEADAEAGAGNAFE
jgi:hypothetical protein